jgi:hypothetical protein
MRLEASKGDEYWGTYSHFSLSAGLVRRSRAALAPEGGCGKGGQFWGARTFAARVVMLTVGRQSRGGGRMLLHFWGDAAARLDWPAGLVFREGILPRPGVWV